MQINEQKFLIKGYSHYIWLYPFFMTTMEITIVDNGDDWEAMYLRGKKINEGHRMHLHDLLAAINLHLMEGPLEKGDRVIIKGITLLHSYDSMYELDPELNYDTECFPEKLADLKREYIDYES